MKLLTVVILIFSFSCFSSEKCVMFWIDENKKEYIKYCSSKKWIHFNCTTEEENELPKDHPLVLKIINSKKFKELFPEYVTIKD